MRKSFLHSMCAILLAMVFLCPTNVSAKLYMGKITLKVGESYSVEAVPTSGYTASGYWSKSGTSFAFTAKGNYSCTIKANYVGSGILSYWGSVAPSNSWTTDIYDLYWDVEVTSNGGGGGTGGGGGNVPVTSVAIYPSSLTMQKGDTHYLIEIVAPADASDKSVSWSSNNTSVATINSSGMVTAKASGTAVITCKANDGSGKQATCDVEVLLADEDMEFTGKTEEGVDMKFHIVSVANKTCGVGGRNYPDYVCIDKETSGSITIPGTVNGYKVVEIGENAFGECSAITSVSMPSTVTRINHWAFYKCSALTQLTGISNLEYIESTAFGGTPWLESLPEGPLYIGKVFYTYKGEMPDNTTVKVKDGTKSIAPYAFHTWEFYSWGVTHGMNRGLVAVEIPASVTQIGPEVYYTGNNPTPFYCPNLQSITVASDNPYYESPEGCNVLVEKATGTLIAGSNTAVIPSTVKTIAPHAFFFLNDITSIIVPDEVEMIYSGAISGCPNLASIYIGKGVKRMFNMSGNGNLLSLFVSPGNEYYDSRDNCNAIIETATNKLIVGCASSTIPSTVVEIGSSAFSGNGNNISSIVIPDNVEKIGNTAFGYWDNLATVVIGKKVKAIEGFAFDQRYPYNLRKVYSLNDFPEAISENAFTSTTYESGTLYVPEGSKLNYMSSTGWSKFKNIVELNPASVNGVWLEENGDAPVYTLSGQRLTAPRRGVNIVGGRKVVVR